MKRKVFSVLFALVLVLSFSLVTAVPAGADPSPDYAAVTFAQDGTGTAEWSTTYARTGSYSVKLYAPASTGDYGKVVMPLDMEFEDLVDFSVWVEGGDTAQQALPLHDIKAVVDDVAGVTLPISNKGTGEGVNLQNKIVVLASQPGQSEELSPTLMSDGIAGWEKYGTHTDATINVGAGYYWSIFVYSAGYVYEAAYDYYTWEQIHAVLDGKATVTEVRIELRYPQDPADVESTVYVDDIEINGVTYAMEPRVINTDTGEGFNTIQAAIDDTETVGGHTITVAAGIYNENLVIATANITLEGAQAGVDPTVEGARADESVIDAGGAVNAITLSADGVTIDGFKVIGSDPGAPGNGAIQVNSDNNTVKNNILTANRWVGIQLDPNTSGNTIADNAIYANGFHGICLLDSSNHNVISGNNIYNNGAEWYVGTPIESGGIGIYLYEHNTYNTITNNIASANYHDGICLHDQSSYNTITGNTANDSVWCNGIGIRNPSDGDKITGNIITGNTANGNNENGIAVGDSENTTIRGNTASNNVKYEGIRLTNSDDNTIENNTCNNNYRDGIQIHNGSDNNTVIGNTASNNIGTWDAAGIRIQLTSTNNTITRNTVSGNKWGISVKTASTGNIIHFNNIYDNADYGLNNETGVLVDAGYNWWGDVAGPKTVGAAPPHNPYTNFTGGNAVSDYVDYLPWLIRIDLVTDFDGWNIVSWPIMGEEGDSEPPPETIGFYWFDSFTQKWDYDPYEAGPLDAMYVKLAEDAEPMSFYYPVSSGVSFPSQKVMKKGWNFVGLAELCQMPAPAVLASAFCGTGEAGPWGYSQVISPSLNGASWTYMRRVEPPEDAVLMLPTKGYWVFMVNDGVLGGFSSTPIVEVEVPEPRP